MKFRYVFMFGAGHLILCALTIGAVLAAYYSDWSITGITAGAVITAIILIDLRTVLIGEMVSVVLVKHMPYVADIVRQSLWSAFRCGGIVGLIDAVSMVIVGWPCWLFFEWFEGDSGYKLVNWSFEYVGRPRWQVTTMLTIVFLVFMLVSVCITLLAVLGWNELLKRPEKKKD
ncbi:MAG: hypothetical protein ACYSWZ_12210 [Planctomycetota bacterium]